MFIDKNKNHFEHGINQWTGEPIKPVFYTKEMAKKVSSIQDRRSKKPWTNQDNFLPFQWSL